MDSKRGQATPDRRNPSIFDRREDAFNYIDQKLSDYAEQRDEALSEKLNALDRYFTLLVKANSEAQVTAIARIQEEHKDGFLRCSTQVKEFYAVINDMREKYNSILFQYDALQKRFDLHIGEYETGKSAQATKNKSFEDWKRDFWVINIPVIVASTTAVVLGALKLLSWLHEIYQKLPKLPG